MITQLTGNGRVLLTLNDDGEWEDLFYPHPGQFRHLREHWLGVWLADLNRFHWLRPGNGMKHLGPVPDVEGFPTTRWAGDGLTLTTEEVVHPNHDVILRVVHLESELPRTVRLFSYQSFTIAESMYQETAYVDPASWSLVHYKRSFYFELFGDPAFTQAVCGEHTLKGLKGTYVDAEDGRLDGRAIAHGAADSVMQWDLALTPGERSTVRIVFALERSPAAVHRVRDDVRAAGPARYEAEAKAYAQAWIARHPTDRFALLGASVPRVVRASLFLLQRSTGLNGSIIASPDTRSLGLSGDSYNYCWWRDGAYVSMAMDDLGLQAHARRFLRFAQHCQSPDGSFLHRHFPDGEIGSTWHPPPFLQVDQTASVIAAAAHHLRADADPDGGLELWPMVKRAANFLTDFRDEETGLSAASFDLWEERFGLHAYSSAATAHALEEAAAIAESLGKEHPQWRQSAREIRHAVVDRMWDPALGRFVRSLGPRDERIDASLLLALDLDLLPASDPRFGQTIETITHRLQHGDGGGVARYEGDTYYGPENPWLVCTLWLALAYLKQGEPGKAQPLIGWVADRATSTGLLAEQVDPTTGEPRSATPLTWSHAAFLAAVHRFPAAASP
jgi:alpha,alpha-trehalase